MALLGGLEPSTHGLEDRCSIHLSYKSKSGAPAGNRTRDLRIKSPLLYQLSYRRIIIGGREGIRTLTSFRTPEPQSGASTNFATDPIYLADSAGFEPASRFCRLPAFQAGTLSHSVNCPYWRREWDSNPRALRPPVFKTGTINRSDIPPCNGCE